MSEYQYYEFAAVDDPLTTQQMAELRARSSRATITPTQFINEYHWGDLKGDPLDWMKHYFDAHIYSANWNSCRLLLRVPLTVLDDQTIAPFVAQSGARSHSAFVDAFGVTRTPGHWVLGWSLNDESGEQKRFWNESDGGGWMTRLLPLRDELLRGDARPLYLGWLARLCNNELSENDVEPPLPTGLRSLTPAQTALAEFLLIDPDWLAATVQASPLLPDAADEVSHQATWIAMLTPTGLGHASLKIP